MQVLPAAADTHAALQTPLALFLQMRSIVLNTCDCSVLRCAEIFLANFLRPTPMLKPESCQPLKPRPIITTYALQDHKFDHKFAFQNW